MANVLFKRGLHSALPAANAATDGVFYLTTDTNRLYVGQGTNLVELNKSITVVDTIANLPAVANVEVGQFYYVKGPNAGADNVQNGNILAVCVSDGTTKRWVQVNPDTNTDTGYDRVDSLSVGTPNINTTAGTITYTITLGRDHLNSDNSTSTLADKTATFTINSSDIGQIVSATAVSIGSSAVSSNSTTVNTSGNGAAGNGFTVTGGSNITLSGSANALTISATDTTYDLQSPAGSATVELTDGSATDTVTFEAGTALSVSGADAGKISYSHANVSSSTTTDSTTASLTDGTGLTVVDGVTVNSQGHVTAVTKKSFTIVDDVVNSAVIGASGEDLTLTLGREHSGDVTATGGTGKLYHNLTIDGTTTKISNQGTLATNLYSASKVDELLAGLNAMTYKGTVGSTGATVTSLPTTGVKVGDTYMVKTDGAGPESSSTAGDLYIASGTETNGVITSGLTWTYVPAGDDTDTTYSFSVAADGTISATPNPGTSSLTVAKIVGGTALTESVSGSTITINHDNIGTATTDAGKNTTGTLAYGGTFKVPYLTTDAQGHVSAISEATLTLPASDDTTYQISVDTDTNGAAIKLSETGGSSSTTAVVVGDGVAISTSKDASDQLKISHNNLLSSGTAGTTYGSSASTTPTAGGSIKVPSLKVNAQGHVTEVGEQTITLPADNDTKYQLRPTSVDVATASGTTTATATLNMSDTSDASSNATSSTLKISSESLTIAKPTGTTDEVNVNIVWGTF